MDPLIYLLLSCPWLTSDNPAALPALQRDHLSRAEVRLSGRRGGLCDYSQTDEGWEWGADTESYCRLAPGVVGHGVVDYVNRTERHAAGSAWIDPTDQPFDIDEYGSAYVEGDALTLGNPGRRTLERSHLNGGVGWQAHERFALGAAIDYTTAHSAKQRDLRHQNKLLDLTLSGGFTWSLAHTAGRAPGESPCTVGAYYFYRRTVEGITFSTAGTTDQTYSSLINYGAAFGLREYSTEEGLTHVNTERPLHSDRHGVAVQVGGHRGALDWMTSVTYSHRDGYYGRHSLYTEVFTHHAGDALGARSAWAWRQAGGRVHAFEVEAEGERLRNYRNVSRYTNEGGGYVSYQYYGRLRTLDRTLVSGHADYHLLTDRWTLGAGVATRVRQLTASHYPLYRQQDVCTVDVHASAERHLTVGLHGWDLGLNAAWVEGGGTQARDGQYDAPTASRPAPDGSGAAQGTTLVASSATSVGVLCDREWDYLTAPRLCLGASVRYSRPLAAWPQVRAYVAADGSLAEAWHADALTGTHRSALNLRLGCIF